MNEPLRVLFVDDHNATRSRMAQAILRAQAGGDFNVSSAGVRPRTIDQHTRTLLAQFDMDPGAAVGASLEQAAAEHYDFVIVLRDERGDEPQPAISFASRPISWDIPDPAAERADDDEARDQNYRRVFELLRQRIQVFVLAQHDELRERGSDNVVGAHQPTDVPPQTAGDGAAALGE